MTTLSRTRCPRCFGNCILEGDERVCLQCGHRPFEAEPLPYVRAWAKSLHFSPQSRACEAVRLRAQGQRWASIADRVGYRNSMNARKSAEHHKARDCPYCAGHDADTSDAPLLRNRANENEGQRGGAIDTDS